ncbi:Uma2 family endonuclease [Opitutaceae bacterium TAV4]|uniref:Uma2 family endonuclease n=1 Tax=Geminisphaera colitermitum TaxID=1148786 RepID=UPI0005B8884B|nr:Uma2 family endonuclease [Geminisphaera colitermitum]RRJ94558.1 Uma2 family endonuclease [Opitutaceae bacterium TAV4]RRJ98620.1 Uma2 family endonuclease [Opitutaceae bacterium TAV3]
MLATTQAPPITRHDYEQIPFGAPNYQLIEGDLIMAPSPSVFHQDISGNLYYLIRHHLRTHPIGTVFMAPLDVFLSDINVYQPDLLFIRKQNASIIKEHGIEGAPDLVVEILSKTSTKYDLGIKRSVYARTGVEEMWAIDPTRRTLAIYRFDESAETPVATHRTTQTFTSTIIPGLSIALKDVFGH